MLNFRYLDRGRVEREDKRRVQERIMNKDAKLQMDSKTTNNNNKRGQTTKEQEPPKKVPERKTKDDYDEIQFKYELENCGRYRLIYPTEDSPKYDKFLAQNQVSLYQDTAASQARASLTKAKIDEYNVKKQLDEQKRVGGTITTTSGILVNKDSSLTSPKDSKVRPESGGKNPPKSPKKKLVKATRVRTIVKLHSEIIKSDV